MLTKLSGNSTAKTYLINVESRNKSSGCRRSVDSSCSHAFRRKMQENQVQKQLAVVVCLHNAQYVNLIWNIPEKRWRWSGPPKKIARMAFLINHVVQGTLFPWTFLESPNFHWSITPQLGGFTGPRHALKIAASPDKHYARASFFLNLKKKRSYLPAKTAPKIA